MPEPGSGGDRLASYNLVAELGAAVGADNPIGPLLELTVRHLVDALRVDYCAVFELLAQENALMLGVAAGDAANEDRRLRIHGGPATLLAYLLETGKPTIIMDAATEARFSVPRWPASRQPVSTISAVIPGRDSTFGVLVAGSSTVRHFDGEAANLLQLLAGLLGMIAARDQQRQDGLARQAVAQVTREEEQQVSEQLRLSEERFAKAFHASPIAMALTRLDSGVFIDANSSYLHMVGYSRDEIIGRTIYEIGILPNPVLRASRVQRLRAEGFLERMEDQLLTREGQVRHVIISSVLITLDGAPCILTNLVDITARRRVEEALRESESRFRLMVETVQDYSIVMLDPQGLIVSWNVGAEHTHGYQAAEILGRHFSIFYTPAELSEGKPALHLSEAASVGKIQVEGWRVRRDGSQFWANVVLTALRDDKGQLYGFGKVVRDTTLPMQAQRDRQSREAAEAANRAKSEFLSRMSHELRTPLNAIIGFSQLMEMGDPTPEQSEHIRHISKAGQHLLALINEVLNIARIEAGRIEISLEPVAVVDVLEDAVELTRSLAEKAGLHLQLEIAPDADQTIMADWQRLRQVLLNLLSNAVKYNRRGGSIVVSCSRIEADRLRLLVRDTGPGIPADKLPRLFTPFERLGAERSSVEGTGLGLALSQRLMEAMGHKLEVSSTVGVGSSFWVDLPIHGPHDVAEAEDEFSVGFAQPEITRNKRILYAEDNGVNLMLVGSIVGRWPLVELLEARSGQRALELAQALTPDLILLDLHLPDMSGYDVLRRLRDDPATGAIPVVVISASPADPHAEALIRSGAQAYLSKPLDVPEFMRVVGDILSDH